ncbi:DUF6107 family protein [Ochrobactrum vermis]|uniref:DUF6107 family protein n=1 Tax=Ochrobactrum vermis TaxID=1827297 RepID=A0ABU8P911_9HYPH|nr:DUF6107 family protein [Ochrobactrum vermis]PQZ29297.1 hypothetical protein CQZ93_03250 [Ochrobactrum vermis]
MANLDALLISDVMWVYLAKVAGAMAGSAVSLAYMLRHGKRDAAIRFGVGVICGVVFGGATAIKISDTLALEGLLGATELLLIGSFAAGFSAWSALGICKRYLDGLKKASTLEIPPDERRNDEKAEVRRVREV